MLLLIFFMTVDTFVSMLAYTSGFKWRPNSRDQYRRETGARNRASVCGLPGWSTVIRTKRPLLTKGECVVVVWTVLWLLYHIDKELLVNEMMMFCNMKQALPGKLAKLITN
jgi:hypothetical protein